MSQSLRGKWSPCPLHPFPLRRPHCPRALHPKSCLVHLLAPTEQLLWARCGTGDTCNVHRSPSAAGFLLGVTLILTATPEEGTIPPSINPFVHVFPKHILSTEQASGVWGKRSKDPVSLVRRWAGGQGAR
jgi:hypothetical protein